MTMRQPRGGLVPLAVVVILEVHRPFTTPAPTHFLDPAHVL